MSNVRLRRVVQSKSVPGEVDLQTIRHLGGLNAACTSVLTLAGLAVLSLYQINRSQHERNLASIEERKRSQHSAAMLPANEGAVLGNPSTDESDSICGDHELDEPAHMTAKRPLVAKER